MESLAEWLGTSTRHVRRLVTEKRVPFVKVGHFVRFDPDDIRRWIGEQKVAVASEAAGGQPPWVRHRPSSVDDKQLLAPRARRRQAPKSDNTDPPWLSVRRR
ncbi:MAG TPA: helix-turn-helix domain-containing protein [Acidimicrobiales bacterium]|nr:helix-turn-helix domain-containing protein [Acidimicrobiales bacterium]